MVPPPAVSKSLLPGGRQIRKKRTRFMISLICMEKIRKIINKSLKNKHKPYIGCWMEQILVPIALPSSPPPPSAKASSEGANKIGKNKGLMIFHDFYEANLK